MSNRVTWTADPIADLRQAFAALDEANAKSIKQYGAIPKWPLLPGTPRHVIEAARRLMAHHDASESLGRLLAPRPNRKDQ